jgi:hypothetical protein
MIIACKEMNKEVALVECRCLKVFLHFFLGNWFIYIYDVALSQRSDHVNDVCMYCITV